MSHLLAALGNGLQPGYQAELIFEVELVKIREKKVKTETEAQ